MAAGLRSDRLACRRPAFRQSFDPGRDFCPGFSAVRGFLNAILIECPVDHIRIGGVESGAARLRGVHKSQLAAGDLGLMAGKCSGAPAVMRLCGA